MQKKIVKVFGMLTVILSSLLPEKIVFASQVLTNSNQQEITFQLVEKSPSGLFQLPATNEIVSGLLAFIGVFIIGLVLLIIIRRRRHNVKKF